MSVRFTNGLYSRAHLPNIHWQGAGDDQLTLTDELTIGDHTVVCCFQADDTADLDS